MNAAAFSLFVKTGVSRKGCRAPRLIINKANSAPFSVGLGLSMANIEYVNFLSVCLQSAKKSVPYDIHSDLHL